MKPTILLKICFQSSIIISLLSCNIKEQKLPNYNIESDHKVLVRKNSSPDFFYNLSDSAINLTKQKVTYDPAYFNIDYPNGDVAANKGVCCDVVIRAYRKMGIDLQKLVHEDMQSNFAAYPKKWGLTTTDKNIDHRRVPNLMKFFERKLANLPITKNSEDYSYGEIVCWDLGSGLTHIGIVIALKTDDSKRNLIVHNIGAGQVIEDCLFKHKIIGHYKYKK